MGGEVYQSWPQTVRFLQQNPHSNYKWVVRGYNINTDISGTETIEEAVLAASLSDANKAEADKG
jgi:hypothetical protein